MTPAQKAIFAAIAVAFRQARQPEYPYIHRSHSSRMTLGQLYRHLSPITTPMEIGHIYGRVINARFLYDVDNNLQIETDEPWLSPDFRSHHIRKLVEINERITENQFAL